MNAILQRLDNAFDSPARPRDMQTLFSAWRVGFWYLIIHAILGVVLGLFIALAALKEDRGLSQISELVGLGQYSATLLMLALGLTMTILLPIRASGLIMGPRWGRYFDQIVLSGISPMRYMAGKILTQNLFFFLILLAALPYAIFCLGLGGVSVLYILECLFALWLYANVLTFITLAAIPFFHELTVVIGMLILFFVIGMFCFIPFTPFTAMISPVRLFIEPVIEVARSSASTLQAKMLLEGASIDAYGIPLGIRALYYGSTILLLLISLLAMLIGPLQCILKSNSTFGEVVFKGDTKKKRMFRSRFKLRRRAEIAFFYQNRPLWVRRWDGLLRYGTLLTCLIALGGLAFASLYHFAPTALSPKDFFTANLLIAGNLLLVGAVIFSNDRSTERTPVEAGPLTAHAGLWSTVCFALLACLVAGAAYGLPYLYDLNTSANNEHFNTYRSQGSHQVYAMVLGLRLHTLFPILFILILEAYAMGRWFAMRSWWRVGATLGGFFMLGLLWFLPTALLALYFEIARRNDLEIMDFSWTSAFLPLHGLIGIAEPSRENELNWLTESPWTVYCPWFHILMTGLFAWLGLRKHQSLAREQSGGSA